MRGTGGRGPRGLRVDAAAPAIAPGLLVRERLLERIGTSRVTLITALPGFGKTVTARQWMGSAARPTAWISLEMLDGEPAVFWAHLVAAVQRVCPHVDDEPAELLAERGPEDPLFLDALEVQLRGTSPATVVLDGVTERSDPLVLNGLTHLVERVGDVLSLVITARSRPALPLARWSSAGWLTELGEADLRLTADEALAVARTIDASAPAARVVALNRRLDGWPIGLHMALLSDQPDAVAGPDVSHHFAAADRTLAEYLVTGVLAGMPARDREVALQLSVLRAFDPGLCRALAGDDAEQVVNRLLTHGTFLTVVDPRTGTMRFHALFRELMEFHLGLTDPIQRVDLHRRAARLLQARGDPTGAYQHLVAIGETGTAREILVEPALALVVEGDLDSLRADARRLPAAGDVDGAELALDLAVIAFYAEGARAARRWCDHAEMLIESMPAASPREVTDLQLRLHARRGAIALVEADLEAAFVHVESYRRLLGDVRVADTFEAQFPVLAARVMLVLRREADVAFWIERARRITSPEVVVEVTVPTLRAWHEWLFGALPTAVQLTDEALAWMDENDPSANHLTFDTLITAGWCRIATGDLEGATKLSCRATEHAEELGYAWHRLQAGYLAAQLAVLVQDPVRALQVIDDLRSGISFEGCQPYSDRIVTVEMEARAALPGLAGELVDVETGPSRNPGSRLLRAARPRAGDDLDALLADRDGWIMPDLVRAELLLLADRDDPSSRDDLARLVATCADAGWVSPFLGLDPAVTGRLTALPLEDLHPELARHLGAVSTVCVEPEHAVQEVKLTEREKSLLPLLGTHLSYAEMGQHLFLSVNTVKANLQRLYRKLDAHTRREAVDAARRRGLL